MSNSIHSVRFNPQPAYTPRPFSTQPTATDPMKIQALQRRAPSIGTDAIGDAPPGVDAAANPVAYAIPDRISTLGKQPPPLSIQQAAHLAGGDSPYFQ
jgi:hypothetical protein